MSNAVVTGFQGSPKECGGFLAQLAAMQRSMIQQTERKSEPDGELISLTALTLMSMLEELEQRGLIGAAERLSEKGHELFQTRLKRAKQLGHPLPTLDLILDCFDVNVAPQFDSSEDAAGTKVLLKALWNEKTGTKELVSP